VQGCDREMCCAVCGYVHIQIPLITVKLFIFKEINVRVFMINTYNK
jgi:hypothetical protein